MAKRIYLALAIHNHQPVGNFDFVFEQGYREAYEPMVAALERHPQMRLALHYTGPLRDWLLAHQPDLLARIRALVARGQAEMMTGGYYEPILVSIPHEDQLGQIRRQTQAVADDFGYPATGLWLAERIWEPHLPLPLSQTGVEYTIVDDTHFKYVGLEDRDLFGYYVTEEQGATLRIFGTSKYLRYTIPWSSVDEVIDYLRAEATEDGVKVAVMGDDGEKFGLWPGTYQYVWQNGWMERFFAAVEANCDWLKVITPGEYVRQFPSLGRIYLPTASYDEMTEWALPARLSWEITHLKHRLEEEGEQETLRFIRGGFWRSFMIKYPEINTMNKKMLLVSDKVHALPQVPERAQAQEALWAGQCNCPYWHGVFGGVYLFHIRSANYERLLAAENIADRVLHPGPWAEAQLQDLDRDGGNEVLLSGDGANLYFDPIDGGSCFEYDWRARAYNLTNVLSRRPEGYHRDLTTAAAEGKVVAPGEKTEEVESIHTTLVRVKERGLEDQLYYDWYRHGSFIDHFLTDETQVEDVLRAQFGEVGDFVNQPYTYDVRRAPDSVTAVLARDGHVWQGDQFCCLRLQKELRLRAGSPDVLAHYTLTNCSGVALHNHFAVETSWGLLGGNGPTASAQVPGRTPFGLNTPASTPVSPEIALRLGWLHMEIGLAVSQPAAFWLFPLETISNSEGGFEKIYQGSIVLACWPLHLEPGATWEVEMLVRPRDVA
jgi:4-alpha-glucanotransferase